MIRADTDNGEPFKELKTQRQRVIEKEALETENKKAMLNIPDTERWYRLVTENISDVIWTVNIDSPTRLNYISPSVTKLLGYTVEEAMNTTMEDVFTPDSYVRAMQALLQEIARNDKKHLNQRQSRTLELEVIRKDGFVVPVEVNFSFIDGVEILAVGRDITERKWAEVQLRQSEAKYSTLVEKGNDGVVIIQDGVLKFANSRMIDITGSPMKEVIGRSFLDFVSPEYRSLVTDKYKKRISGEKTASRYEIEILPNEGKRLPVEISGTFIEYEGRPADMVVIRDISERKEAELQQKEIEEELKTYLENAPDGIYINDLKGVFLYGNKRAEEILGYKREELVGSNFLKLNLLPPKHLARAGKLLALNVTGKNTGPDEFELIKKDKSSIWVEINTSPIKFGHKSVVIGFVRDIAERKQIEEALKISEQNFRNTLDSSLMGIRISDIDNNTFYVNQAFLDIYGYRNLEDVRTSPPQEHLTPESYASHLQRRKQFLQDGSLLDSVEIDILRKDGTIRNLQVFNGKVFWDGKDQYQTFYSDITDRKRGEESLKNSEEFLNNIIENTPNALWVSDEKGTIIRMNQALRDLLKIQDEEIIGKYNIFNDTQVIDQGYLPLIKSVFEDGKTIDFTLDYTTSKEKQVTLRESTHKTLDIVISAIKDKNAKVINAIAQENDITDRRRSEEALKASEQNFHNSLDGSLMGIRIVDAEWHTLYVNKVFLDIFGFNNIDEVKRTSLQDYYTPEEHARYLQRKEKRERGESVPDCPAVEIVGKNGIIHFIKVYLKEVLWNGKQQRQLVYHDVTEQKQAQQNIERSAQEWRTTFDSITDFISIHDKNNRIIRVNKAMAALLKTTPQELVGKFCHEVMHGAKEPPVNCPHWQSLINSKPISIETFNSDLGVHLQESASLLFNEKGEIIGSVVVARDVTKQKRMEEQLIMTDRLASIGELSSGIAHELNNPLTSVIGFSQLLMEGYVPEDMKEGLGILYGEAQRAAAIVKNLLTFARKHAPVKQLSQVNTVIEDVLRLRAYEQKVNNIEVESRLSPDLPETMIDHFQMQQVFLNIVVNAEFAMQEAHQRGKLTITTESSNGIIRTTFTDDGPGISPENLKHIFDPFFTTKEVGKGTGLGLSICHGIVTEHGGRIYASSEKGMGASFVVELPLDLQ